MLISLSQRERNWMKCVNQPPPLPLGEGKLIEVNYQTNLGEGWGFA